jgi:aryl-alcohol dehydrogenase-like predicted oxidoreductase
MARLGTTDLEVFPLCLGGNVFGWTADEREAGAVLDTYAAAGGNFVDTADSYAAWAPGGRGGESEEILGRWMAARGNRDSIVVATKVGMLDGLRGLAAETVRTAAEASLRRLGTDRIDLYYAHRDDPDTPLADTLAAFDALVREGKVRHVGASNYTAPRLTEALEVSAREGLARFAVLQPRLNLVARADYGPDLAGLCLREDVACVPYAALASGFLTGKYRPGGAAVSSPRAGGARAHLERGGADVLAALDDVAAAHDASVAAVAVAWARAQPAVVAPIASARTPGQLAELLPAATLALDRDELDRLEDAAGRYDPVAVEGR